MTTNEQKLENINNIDGGTSWRELTKACEQAGITVLDARPSNSPLVGWIANESRQYNARRAGRTGRFAYVWAGDAYNSSEAEFFDSAE